MIRAKDLSVCDLTGEARGVLTEEIQGLDREGGGSALGDRKVGQERTEGMDALEKKTALLVTGDGMSGKEGLSGEKMQGAWGGGIDLMGRLDQETTEGLGTSSDKGEGQTERF